MITWKIRNPSHLQERFRRNDDFDRFQTTLVERDIFRYQAAEAVDYCTVRDGLRSVCIACVSSAPVCSKHSKLTIDFWSGTSKVKYRLSFLSIDCNLKLDWTAIIHIIDGGEILTFEPFTNVFQQMSYTQFSIILDLLRVSKLPFSFPRVECSRSCWTLVYTEPGPEKTGGDSPSGS